MLNLLRGLLDGEEVLVHCEFQTTDSTHADMVERTVDYLGRCYGRYGLPIFSHVIYLRPNAGRNDPGGYVQDVTGHRLIVEYKVIRLIEVEGQSVLEAQQPGLLPFCPLMKPPEGIDALTWLNQCVETTKSLTLDAPIRNNLLFRVWDSDEIKALIKGLFHTRPSCECFALWLDRRRRQNIGDLKTIDTVFIRPRIEGICVG